MWPYLLLCVSGPLPLNFGDSWPSPPLPHTSCLPNIPSHLCPLCRKPFTSIVKLHLDVDDVSKGFPITPPLNITQSEQEARRLLGLFGKALDHGFLKSAKHFSVVNHGLWWVYIWTHFTDPLLILLQLVLRTSDHQPINELFVQGQRESCGPDSEQQSYSKSDQPVALWETRPWTTLERNQKHS